MSRFGDSADFTALAGLDQLEELHLNFDRDDEKAGAYREPIRPARSAETDRRRRRRTAAAGGVSAGHGHHGNRK